MFVTHSLCVYAVRRVPARGPAPQGLIIIINIHIYIYIYIYNNNNNNNNNNDNNNNNTNNNNTYIYIYIHMCRSASRLVLGPEAGAEAPRSQYECLHCIIA